MALCYKVEHIPKRVSSVIFELALFLFSKQIESAFNYLMLTFFTLKRLHSKLILELLLFSEYDK